MKQWAAIYLAGALAMLLAWVSLPDAVLALTAAILFFVFAVALVLLGLTRVYLLVRR